MGYKIVQSARSFSSTLLQKMIPYCPICNNFFHWFEKKQLRNFGLFYNPIWYNSPVGVLLIGCFENKIVLCDWKYRKMRAAIDERIKNFLNASFCDEEVELHKLCKKQLEEYFERKREKFDLPLLFCGTEFQTKVWQCLLEISYGTTTTYLQLATHIKMEKAIRAVASANGANAISIIVPCHRVIGSQGDLTGYAGGLAVKKRLLELEQNNTQPEFNF